MQLDRSFTMGADVFVWELGKQSRATSNDQRASTAPRKCENPVINPCRLHFAKPFTGSLFLPFPPVLFWWNLQFWHILKCFRFGICLISWKNILEWILNGKGQISSNRYSILLLLLLPGVCTMSKTPLVYMWFKMNTLCASNTMPRPTSHKLNGFPWQWMKNAKYCHICKALHW